MTTLSGWIDALVETRQEFEKEPKRGFLDLSGDPIPEEISRDQGQLPGGDDMEDEEEPWQGPLPLVERRLRGKVRVREEEVPGEEANDMDQELQDLFEREGIHDEEGEPESGDREETNTGMKREYPEEEATHLEERIEPASKRSRTEYLEIYMLKVNNLINARQRKEVQVRALSKKNQECFRKAMEKEVNNNIKTGAYAPRLAGGFSKSEERTT